MSKQSGLTREELTGMVKKHLESLGQAGLEWLPAGPTLESPPVLECSGDRPSPSAEIKSPSRSPAIATPLFSEKGAGTTDPKGSVLTLEQRRQELAVLAQKVSQCTRCPELASTRTQTVFGVGPPGVELCFIGEAPGADEDAQGEPFVGAAGQLLNRIITACGMKRAEVYICNIIKCRPPGNRTPSPQEAGNCREFLDQQLELLRPKFICCLGSTAVTHLLQTTKPLGQMRGRFHDYKGIPVMVTYHPAYLLPHRNPAKKKDVWEDMKMLLARMGRAVP
jgi:uracil-DNA glycosylase